MTPARIIVLTAALALTLTACSTTPPPPTPAYKTAALDAGTTPTPAAVTATQNALTALQHICTGTPELNADMAAATHTDLAAIGVDETRLSILQHVTLTPPTTPPTPCQTLFTAYAVSRSN